MERADADGLPVDPAGLRGGRRRQDGAQVRPMHGGRQHRVAPVERAQRRRDCCVGRRDGGGTVAWPTGAGRDHDGEDQGRPRPLLRVGADDGLVKGGANWRGVGDANPPRGRLRNDPFL